MNIHDDAITQIDRWLDAACSDSYQAQPLAQDWARLAKVAEELGEAINELILATGQNPRKPQDPAARDRMLKEVADVAATGILCIQHFTKDVRETERIVAGNFAKILQRNPEILALGVGSDENRPPTRPTQSSANEAAGLVAQYPPGPQRAAEAVSTRPQDRRA